MNHWILMTLGHTFPLDCELREGGPPAWFSLYRQHLAPGLGHGKHTEAFIPRNVNQNLMGLGCVTLEADPEARIRFKWFIWEVSPETSSRGQKSETGTLWAVWLHLAGEHGQCGTNVRVTPTEAGGGRGLCPLVEGCLCGHGFSYICDLSGAQVSLLRSEAESPWAGRRQPGRVETNAQGKRGIGGYSTLIITPDLNTSLQ